jgi:predicted nucleic acid-binding protein
MPDVRVAFADANWLVSAYHETRDSAAVRDWARRGQSTVVISAAVLAECQCNLWRLGNQWPVLEQDVRTGLWIDCGQTFEALAFLARDLFRRFAPRCNVGTLDLLHIAAARHFGCRWFLSFDTNSGCRAVAHQCRLRLFPPLQDHDRAWLQKLGS